MALLGGYMNSILNKIIQVNFPETQYIKEQTQKNQIYLHHTVSNGINSLADINYWLSTTERIATSIIIQNDGTPYQCFSTKYWGYHLGVKKEVFAAHGIPYINLDKYSIGVEIDSAGGLTKKNGKWYSCFDSVIPDNNVIEYPNGFRGFYGFEKYTDAQIQTLRELLLYWNNVWKISLEYDETIFDINLNALKGNNGIYTHCSVRKDKSDVHPQIELINMLRGLK